MRILLFTFILFDFNVSNLSAQTTTTNLKDETKIQTFLKVTEQIRCICLPSLPIQSCSFNMCSASSYLKNFIENRINEGMGEKEILEKMENGFGDSVRTDPIVLHFLENGNEGMVNSILFGFGPNILAKPDGTWINTTLLFIGILGLFFIYRYANKKSKTFNPKENLANKESVDSIKQRIRDLESKES
ncbi:cytochrome c-type biogenesis protein CcmH [Leptospira sp. 96542]|nr:cytochrome c-type biogenesis protein CcmH [Leptospira sp. 96542]